MWGIWGEYQEFGKGLETKQMMVEKRAALLKL